MPKQNGVAQYYCEYTCYDIVPTRLVYARVGVNFYHVIIIAIIIIIIIIVVVIVFVIYYDNGRLPGPRSPELFAVFLQRFSAKSNYYPRLYNYASS